MVRELNVKTPVKVKVHKVICKLHVYTKGCQIIIYDLNVFGIETLFNLLMLVTVPKYGYLSIIIA